MLKTIGELQELITTLYIGFLGLIFSSYFVYLSEKGRSLNCEKRKYKLSKNFENKALCTSRSYPWLSTKPVFPLP
jgi:hypothetical protein